MILFVFDRALYPSVVLRVLAFSLNEDRILMS